MTAITIPQMDEKPAEMTAATTIADDEAVEVKTGKASGVFWVICVLFFLFTLLAIAAFTCYLIVNDRAPSCVANPPPARSTDVTFKRHGKLSGTDVDFEEDCHYDHGQNTLVTKLSGGDASSDNATVIHDYSRGVTTRVLEAHKRCYLGALELDDGLNLPIVNNGDVQELQYVRRHRYRTMGPIAPEYLARTASPLVRDYCGAGMQISWIAPSTSTAAAAANPSPLLKRAARDLGLGLLPEVSTIIGLPDGTVISDMTNRVLLKLYGL